MPEDEINEIKEMRGFTAALTHQNKTDEQIKEHYYSIFKKLDNYNRLYVIKMLMYHRQDLGFEIFRETTESHIEKIIE